MLSPSIRRPTADARLAPLATYADHDRSIDLAIGGMLVLLTAALLVSQAAEQADADPRQAAVIANRP